MLCLVSGEQRQWRRKGFSPPGSGQPMCQASAVCVEFPSALGSQQHLASSAMPASASIFSGSLIAACHPQGCSCDPFQPVVLQPLHSGVLRRGTSSGPVFLAPPPMLCPCLHAFPWTPWAAIRIVQGLTRGSPGQFSVGFREWFLPWVVTFQKSCHRIPPG